MFLHSSERDDTIYISQLLHINHCLTNKNKKMKQTVILLVLLVIIGLCCAQEFYDDVALNNQESVAFDENIEEASTLQTAPPTYYGWGDVYVGLYPTYDGCYRACGSYIGAGGYYLKNYEKPLCTSDCQNFSPCFYWCRSTYPQFTSSGHHKCAFQCAYDHYNNIKRYF